MSVVCPTVLAKNIPDYARQLERVAGFASRVQVDLMDSEFAHSDSELTPDDIWWSPHLSVDIHLMYADPFAWLDVLKQLQPHMVIIHVETMVHHMHFAAELHAAGIAAGLAILPKTPVANVEQILHSFDHLLIFSGDLGKFGGQADMGLLEKVSQAKAHHPELEIGWDGGVNVDNASQLAQGGVDVLNVGGFIQNAENPAERYRTLVDQLV